ncbi:MAG TPA: flagellar basal body L-ring protein FlgH [Dongiaceae bacterium]|jgi:flagellar L-ring protein precursor FlgH|nr:flagellar basal body L-ring protein FlgH [Dongiaceae bacterium]
MNRGAAKTKQGEWRIGPRRIARGRPRSSGNTRVARPAPRRVVPLALVLAVASISLGGCGNMLEKISEVGKPPAFDPIQNPVAQASYQPVTMPMPAPMTDVRQPNSLWRQGSRTFFADQRASKIGDILTVVITIDDSAKLANKTVQSRDGSNNADLTALLGYQAGLHNIFGHNVNPADLVDTSSTTAQTGDGTIDRSEAVDLRVAAVITQVLPNGNMVLKGTQQVRINTELRELDVEGIIRPQDISTANEIPYDQIAEARIAYGGRGTISDVQQPRYGQQVYDILFPF